jgi:adenosylcobinamide-GDP ribazoletransferase
LHAPADTQGPATQSPVAPTVAAPTARAWRPWQGLAGAIAFLTIVPVPARSLALADSHEPGLGATAGWFPLVGAAVGASAGVVRLLLGHVLGASVATVLAMIALVALTGALHQDGLADTADGLGVRNPTRSADGRERRLEVMRDSSTGAFGALALIAWALLLFSTLTSLDGAHALRALVVACALARWAALVHAAATPAARRDGLGAALSVTRIALGVATAVAVIAALAICGLGAGAAALATAMIVASLSVVFARRMLGGRTGDTLGATVAIAELAVCVVLLGVWQG